MEGQRQWSASFFSGYGNELTKILALKHGHSTRPLAVVKKKTLSGIGKDRDEAVPFWDQ